MTAPPGYQPCGMQQPVWNGQPAPQPRCRCGRELIREGLCSRCLYDGYKCTCIGLDELVARLLPGGVVLDEPAVPAALWGSGSQVLHAYGEALIICGGDGTGKTTLSGNLIRHQLGLGSGELLGHPVAELAEGKSILYLAMDRPRQAMRLLHRLFTEAEREVLDRRLKIWKGPPPSDLAADPGLLAELCQAADAGVCYVDSLKDAALGLSDDQTAARGNRARQSAINGGTELVELHHPRKASGDNPKPRNLEDVYGSRWIPAGAGSVIFLWGSPGDAVVELYHRKQPAEEIAPMKMVIDGEAGTVTSESTDIIGVISAGGLTEFTARTAAMVLNQTAEPDLNQIEKARRRPEGLVREGKVVPGSAGGRGQGHAATWKLPPDVAARVAGPQHDVEAWSYWQGLFSMADHRAPDPA